METFLVKIFATALTLSQVTTAPQALKTEFDRVADQGRVVALLRDGCAHMRQASVSAADRASFYQLKTMMQGVLQRGTARALAPLAPYVAGKTGTTEDENDTWSVGFSNEITVAVWVGYDNAGDTHRTLGEGSTGASVAAPIFESIIGKTVLAPPSAAAHGELSCGSLDPESGKSRRRGSGECLRLDQKGRPIEARNRLIGRDSVYARRNPDDLYARRGAPDDEGYGNWGQ